MPDAFDLAAEGQLDAFDRAAAQRDVFDQAADGELDAFDLAAQGGVPAPTAPGEDIGRLAGSILARANEGSITQTPASWGDVFSSAGKVSLPGQLLTVGKALLGDEKAYGDLQQGPIKSLSPQEKEGFFGTVVPTYAAAGGLLAGGPAGLGIGPFLGREAIGIGTGAATRSMTAAGRGQDPVAAAYDPTGLAIDATMGAVPEIFAGSKYAAGKVWDALPDSVTAPVANAAGSAARYVGDTAKGAVSKAANWIAKRKPGYGETLLEDRPVTMDDIFGGQRPDLRPDLATEPIEGLANRHGGRTITDQVTEKLSGNVRLLRNLGRDDLADQIELANNMERRLSNHFGPLTDRAIEPLATGPAADAATTPLSARVVDVVEGGRPLTGEGQGAQAARFADMLRRPDIYDPELQRLAENIRDPMAQLGEAGTKAGVYDQLKGAGTRARVMELHDQGVDVVPIGGPDDSPARWFAERQLVQDGRYYPHQPMPDPLAPGISEETAIERIAAQGENLSHRAAMRRLTGLRTSGSSGFARLAEEGAPYNKYAPEVLPAHVRADIPRIANATAFGGKPVDIKVALPGRGTVELTVGEKAAAQLSDLYNRKDWRAYDAYARALVERYAPPTASDGLLSMAASATSRMALPRAFLTQVGQMPTGAIMHGGVTGMARGIADVEANPVLRDIFRIGAQSHEFTDYAARALGETAERGAPFMKPTENFLRGPSSYVAVPMIKDTAKEAAAMLQANEPFSGALMKKCAEMGTTPEALGTEYLSTGGVMSHATWLDTIQHLTNRWQHVQGAGEVPDWARTQAGAAAAQFKLFGLKQSQLMYDDVIKPIVDGIRNGDKSLRDLGLARLARTAYLGAPANATAAGLRAVASGRLPTAASAIRSAVTGPTGMAGDLGYGFADRASGHKYGDNEFRNFKEIPALSVWLDTLGDVSGIAQDPGAGFDAAARLGGIYDSRIPLYLTPAVNVARQLYRGKLD